MTVRGAASAAAWGLHAHRGTAALLVLCAALALAAVLPVAAMLREGSAGSLAFEPRLLLPPTGPLSPEPVWAMARTPAWLQGEAVGRLFHTLLGAALGTFAVGALGVLLLFAARTAERSGEVAVRRAVGASRAAIRATAVLEAGAVAGGALVLGVAGGSLAARGLMSTWPGPLTAPAFMPEVAAAFIAVLMILAGAGLAILFAPRRRLTDASSRPLGLVVPTLQLGLALIILTAGGLMARHVAAGSEIEISRPARGQVLEATSPEAGAASRSAQYAALLQALGARQEFDSVSLTAPGAVVGLGTVSVTTTDCGVCPFGGLLVPWHSVPATHQVVSADSFQALGVHLVAGRGITGADGWSAPRVAVVNRALALRHFENGDAIGRRLLLGDDPRTWHTVVGIVDDPPSTGLGAALLPPFTVYASVLQHPPAHVELLLRPGAGGMIRPSVDSTVAHLLGSRGVTRRPEAVMLSGQRAPVAWFAGAFAAEGWAMLVIAALSSLVQIRLWVRSLRPELGVRRAIGARRLQILSFVLLRAALVGVGGIAVGLWFGPAVWSGLGNMVGGLPEWDAGLVLRFAALLVGICTAGAVVPAWRAARTAPAELLAEAGT